MNITKQQIFQWFQAIPDVIAENKETLNELDAALGNADHGTHLHQGFQKVLSQLPPTDSTDVGGLFKAVGMTLMSNVSSESGSLYGSFFLRAASAVAGKQALTATELAGVLYAGISGVVQRGKANPGEKTMLDALCPAADHLMSAVNGGAELTIALEQAVSAAKQGMEDTIPLVASKGRASYLGDRSVGHQDPGATSAYLILKTLLDTITAG